MTAPGPELITDGKSRYSIIVSSSATPPELFAARELQRYLQKITSVELPIANQLLEPALIVGSFFGEQLPARLRNRREDSFFVERRGENILLLGNSPRGTLYSVYFLLETYLGCGWLTPGDDVVPTKLRVELPRILGDLEEPQFEMRSLWMYPFIAERNLRTVDWAAKNRLNWVAAGVNSSNLWTELNSRSLLVPEIERRGLRLHWGGHSFNTWVSPRKYFASHPEYFSLIDGKRDPRQLCVSNTEVVRVAAENINRFLEQNPEVDMVDVMLNDVAAWCECKQCELMEGETRLSAFSVGEKKPYYTHANSNMKFVNRIARRVAEKHPEVLLESLAYLMLLDAPTQVLPETNVMVGFAALQRRVHYTYPIFFPDDELNNVHLREMRKWLDLVGPERFYAYEYYSRTSTARRMINMNTTAQDLEANLIDSSSRTFHVYADTIPKDLWFYRQMGLQNVQSEEWDWEEINMYLYARSLWDLHKSSNFLIEDYCRRAYGQAADPMIQHWLILQETKNPYRPEPAYPFTWQDRSSRQRALSLLSEAVEMTRDPAAVRRIQRLQEIWSHL